MILQIIKGQLGPCLLWYELFKRFFEVFSFSETAGIWPNKSVPIYADNVLKAVGIRTVSVESKYGIQKTQMIISSVIHSF